MFVPVRVSLGSMHQGQQGPGFPRTMGRASEKAEPRVGSHGCVRAPGRRRSSAGGRLAAVCPERTESWASCGDPSTPLHPTRSLWLAGAGISAAGDCVRACVCERECVCVSAWWVRAEWVGWTEPSPGRSDGQEADCDKGLVRYKNPILPGESSSHQWIFYSLSVLSEEGLRGFF